MLDRSGVPRGAECSILPFSGRCKEKSDSTARDAESRSKKTSLASSSVREHAVPRHRQATCLMLITVRSQNMCRTCFVLCSVFSLNALDYTSTWAGNNVYGASFPIFPVSAMFASRTQTSPERRPKFVAVEHT